MRINFIIKIISINTLIFFIGCIASEIFIKHILQPDLIKLRVSMNKKARKHRDPITHQLFDKKTYKFKSNSKNNISHKEFNYSTFHDENGWRSPCNDKNIKTDTFLIGDSFVYGMGVIDEHTISCNLSKKGLNTYTLGLPGGDFSDYTKIIENNIDIFNKLSKFKNPKIITVLYLGNDFESIINYKSSNLNPQNGLTLSSKSSVKKKNKFLKLIKEIAHYINQEITYNNFLGLGDSYLVAGIKVSLMNLKGIESGGFYSMYDNTTFYLKKSNQKYKDIEESFNNYLSKISIQNLDHIGFLLIPAASEIDSKRLIRDAKLRRVNPEILDPNFKYESVKKACRRAKLKCYDAREVLKNQENIYYIHDNHLNKKGVLILSNYLEEVINKNI